METKKIQLEILERFKESHKGYWKYTVEELVDQFIKDNNLKPSIEVGKYYKVKGTDLLICVTDVDKQLGYGFDNRGVWHENSKWGFNNLTEATQEEWQSRLEQYAETLGYNHEELNYECLLSNFQTLSISTPVFEVDDKGDFLVTNDNKTNYLMINGVWAKTFEKSDKDKIKELEQRIKQLELTIKNN